MCNRCSPLSRRTFLAAIAVASAVPLRTGRTYAQDGQLFGGEGNATLRFAPHYRNISWNTYSSTADTRGETPVPYPSPIGFGSSEQKRLSEAVTIVANRFLRKDIFDTAMQNKKLIPMSGMERRSKSDRQGKLLVDSSPQYPEKNAAGLYLSPQEFLTLQFAALWNNGFPRVDFYAWRPTKAEQNHIWGFARVGDEVSITRNLRVGHLGPLLPDNAPFHPFQIQGNFKIWLSIDRLRSESADQMAGVIAHEMLHNLGHDHPNGYYDDNFTTVFGDTLANNGQYRRRLKSRPGFGLRGGGSSLPECG
jgi:hypothetical protein